MKKMSITVLLLLTGWCSLNCFADTAKQKLPYIYTEWEHVTAKNGLPDDHIFAVKVDGPRVWVGTEDGLARIDKASGKIQTWNECLACFRKYECSFGNARANHGHLVCFGSYYAGS